MKRINSLLATLLSITVLLVNCKTDSEKEIKTSLNGVWKSIGHGWALIISDSTNYAFYDLTSISCLPRQKGSLQEISNSLRIKNDTLIVDQGDIVYWCTRTDELPKLCQSVLDDEKINDPLYNFDVYAENVKEHYAFMELNNINWDELYRQQRGKLNGNSTAAELFLVIEETSEILNDNHAFLEATEDVYEQLDELEEEPEAESPLQEYGDFEVAEKVAATLLQEDMTKDSWLVHWGKMADDIGYIQLKAMWLYADMNMPKALIDSLGYVDAYAQTRSKMYEVDYQQKEIEGVNKVLDQIMNDIEDSKAIVIDARFNGGGQEVVSFEILKRFNPERLQAAKHKFRFGNQYTKEVPIYLESHANAYTKPVYILTSPQSGSAAESFSLISQAMPHVKRIGSTTEGATSTTLDKVLPNGWEFSISSEVYMDNKGKCYENIGIPVDYELNYSRDRQAFFRSVVNDLEKDRKTILGVIERIDE